MTRSKDIGTLAETAVVKFLQANGFPHAERRALRGNLDCGDITGTPGIVWEVKSGKAAETASDGQIEKWLDETEVERKNALADFGVLVVKRKGIGPANAGDWWAITRDPIFGHTRRGFLRDYVTYLRHVGYGDPNPAEGDMSWQ